MSQNVPTRAKLPLVSEQMKAWSSALADEIAGWPQVATRSFFGFTALYRKDKMFGALPRTRAMQTPNSLVFKLETPAATERGRIEKDPRIGDMQMQKARWYTFEISSDSDLHEALDWLRRAYDAAPKGKSSK